MRTRCVITNNRLTILFVSFAGCKAIGLLIGTGVGGMLAMPADHYPTWFSATGVFGR